MKIAKNIFQKLFNMGNRKIKKFDVIDSLYLKKESFINEYENILPGSKVVITIFLN